MNIMELGKECLITPEESPVSMPFQSSRYYLEEVFPHWTSGALTERGLISLCVATRKMGAPDFKNFRDALAQSGKQGLIDLAPIILCANCSKRRRDIQADTRRQGVLDKSLVAPSFLNSSALSLILKKPNNSPFF